MFLLGSCLVSRAAEVNAVGYADVAEPDGYALIANPFSEQENRVDQIFHTPLAEGTLQILKS